ncbi:MAG: hypothetical protein JRH12_22325 [Deltaproteobacteria bacterium]|jgi:hypothetical protein|nr:hypothetical protein [Deltaproteobacteria bacterium]MBW2480570.1 hypothetical protein [Deltaproteobacteria bacterium]
MLDNNLIREEVTLIGFVYEIEEGRWVTGIGISTGDESYIVEKNQMGEALSKEVENDVRVSGYISKGLDGQNRILVTAYEVLADEFNPDTYNDLLDEEMQ